MWKKTDTDPPPPSTPPTRPSQGPPTSRELAIIGGSISVRGDISGEENLQVDGRVEGKISLENHNVTVGRSGKVKADIHGRHIRVEGAVDGNLFGKEEVVVCESGKVEGNITAPQVSLEKGATFRGSIDMSPRSSTPGPNRLPQKPMPGGPAAAPSGPEKPEK